MSLALNPLRVVEVKEPRTKVDNVREYAVLQGGGQVSWKPVITTSFSDSSIQFTCPPPNPGILVDRKVLLQIPFQVTLTGTVSAGNLYQPGLDAPRAFPIASVISTITATINNTQVSINLSDVFSGLIRYNTVVKTREIDYSLTPSMLDQSQEYSSLVGANRNPLAPYGTSVSGADLNRGAFPVNIISNTPTSAVLQFIVTEPLFLSPFLFGQGEHGGFIGVQALDFNITLGNLSRVWSSAVTGAGHNVTSVVGHIYSNPQMLFNYITPKELSSVPRSVVYPFFEVQRYPTDVQSPLGSLVSTTINSSNIQLQNIPRRLYIFARERNQDLTFAKSDTFAAINSISVNWNNYSGLLSSATQQDLYEMSVKNGCNLSWAQWSGFASSGVGTPASVLGSVGSVLAIDLGCDIGLNDMEAPGLLGTYQLQMSVNITNTNTSRAIQYSLYVVTISEGSFTITENRSVSQVGVISKQDILNSRNGPEIPYQEAKSVNGGNFFSDVKNFFTGLRDKVKPYVSPVLDFLPGDARLKLARDITGLGARKKKAKRKGGVVVGGKRMTKSSLASRLL